MNLLKREFNEIVKGLIISFVSCALYVSIYYAWYGHIPYLQEELYSTYFFLFIGFFSVTFTIGKLFQQLLLSRLCRFFSVFIYYFLLFAGIWMTTYRTFNAEFNLENMLFTSILVSVITAIFISLFYGQNKKNISFFKQLKSYFSDKSLLNWTGRIVLAVTLLFATYYFMNELIFPFLEPYYDNHSFIIGEEAYQSHYLVNKSWMLNQSILMLIIFLPLFALWRGSKSSLLFWVGFPLFLICAVGPFLFNIDWPLGFRFTLLVEMTAIMYIQSFIIVHLFFVPKKDKNMNHSGQENDDLPEDYYNERIELNQHLI